ncbi:MAG: hypothetical protein HPY66_3112 [Firmicutes bacterium]|nr:hypothetical protein [Bacillota bacterium]MDI6706827.1 hypothetical protein [Bacillota bacterium]
MGRILDRLKDIAKFFADFNRGFFEGARENSIRVIKKDAFDANDYFILLCFSDFLGIPSPASYYTLELLPYMAKELEGWEIRMDDKKDILSEQFEKYHFH